MKKKIGFLVATTLAVGLSVIGVSAFGNDKLNEKAFSDAGVNQTEVRDIESELDVKNGKEVYEVEFESNGHEYDYDIDANTGEILQSEKEPDKDVNKKKENKETKADQKDVTDIGKAKAKAIAFKDADVSESKATGLRVERDYDDGRLEYNVEFRVGNKEYEYEIDAKTGKILDKDIDINDKDDDDDNDDRWDD